MDLLLYNLSIQGNLLYDSSYYNSLSAQRSAILQLVLQRHVTRQPVAQQLVAQRSIILKLVLQRRVTRQLVAQ
jgi:hypothetical protein